MNNKKDNNTLFNRKILKKAIDAQGILKNGEIPEKHKKLIEKRLSNQALHKKTKERTQSHDFLNFFKELLNYKSVGDQYNAKTWDIETELKNIDYALGAFSKSEKKVLVPFEFKAPDTYDLTRAMKGRTESTVAQALRYANHSQGTAKWFLVSNCLEFRLYKFPESTNQYEQWFIEDLLNPEEYARFILLLNKTNLLGGFTEQLFKDSLQQQKDITNQLYRDYRQLRIDLINGLKKENNTIRRKTMVRLSQKLLDRILFIAFAEDRDLLPPNTLHHRIFSEPSAGFTVWDVLKKLFHDIDKGNKALDIPAYNGGLFSLDTELEQLTISDELLKKFKILYEYDFDNDIGTPILGHIFEQSIADLDEIYSTVDEEQELQNTIKTVGTSGKRKQDGIVYTPEFITDYIVDHTLGGYLIKQQANIKHEFDSAEYWLAYRNLLANTRILDPACGSGAFLIAAFNYLKQEYHFINQRIAELDEKHADLFGLDLNAEILNNNLFGVDLNPESIEITQLALWLETAERGKQLKPLDKNIQQGNSIIHHKHTDKNAFLWNVQFNKVMESGGFDVILGNPPYVRQERLSAIKPYLQEHYQTYHGVADLYTYFFELGLSLLKKGGYLGYISSSTFFRTHSGTPLRDYLKIQSNLLTVIDFNDYPVFEGVTIYPAILILEKPERSRKKAPQFEFKFLNISAKKDNEHQALKQELQTDFTLMKQAALKTDAWQLEDERFFELRQKITQGYKTLKEVYGSPFYGIKTGLNEAFVIDTKKTIQPTFCGVLTGLNEAFVINATQYQVLKQDDPNGDILKPFLEGKDLKRWRAESRDLYLIFTRRGVNIDDYPLIKVHLEQFKERLEPKPTDYPANKTWNGRKSGIYQWYEIQDTVAYYKQFNEGKIVWGNLQSTPSFLYDDQGYFINAPSPILPTTEKWLVAYLNSNVCWFFLKSIAISRSGGFIECKPVYINQIPIPDINDEQKNHIADLAKQCEEQAKQRYQLEKQVQRRLLQNLRPEQNNESLNTKLTEWWKLKDILELINEARKAFKLKKSEQLKTDLTNLNKQDEWESYLTEKTKQWQNHTNTIQGLEKQINQTVYELFNLSDAEIKLIEQNN